MPYTTDFFEVYLVWVVISLVVGGLIGGMIGGFKGRLGLGIVLGALLGVIGWIIVGLMSDKPKMKRRRYIERTDKPTMAGWYADPLFRHELRYFDGFNWRSQVSDRGVLSIDEPAAGRVPGTSEPVSPQAQGPVGAPIFQPAAGSVAPAGPMMAPPTAAPPAMAAASTHAAPAVAADSQADGPAYGPERFEFVSTGSEREKALYAARPAASGWFIDPTAPDQERYFNGSAWTARVRDALG